VSNKDELINKIVEKEWNMFSSVQNEGGPAPCQDDKRNFEINRISQTTSWSEAALASYLRDLEAAEADERNLMTEKYARMMKSTAPQEYANIEHMLPAIDPEVPTLIDKIAAIVLKWEEELAGKYPNILSRGRPIHSSQDTPGVTSLETYLKGELSTYSADTLKLFLENAEKQRSENVNGSEITMAFMMKQYGFNSLDEANQRMK
jgi:hypothetical protein